MVGEQAVHNLGRAAAAVEDIAHQVQVVDGRRLISEASDSIKSSALAVSRMDSTMRS